MLVLDQTIEEEKLAFLLELQRRFPSIEIEQISVAAANIEQLIEFKILDRVLSNIARIFSDPNLSATGTYFQLMGHIFEMSVAEDLKRGDSLIYSCACRSVDMESGQPVELQVPLQRPGRYRNVVFLLPALVQRVDEAFLVSLVTAVFDVAYNWLNDSLRRAIAKATADTNQSLYQFVKMMIPEQQLLEGFLFSVLIDGKGASKAEDVVILNDEAAHLSTKLASEAAHKLGRNPADIAMEMMTEVVPYADSVIPDVCEQGKPIDISLISEKYYQGSMSFNLAMQAIWGNTVTCYPIVMDGQFRLVAFYKPQYKNVITPFLDIHKVRLAEMAQSKIDLIRKGLDIVKRIKRKSDIGPATWWAQICGAFMGAYERAHHG